MPYIKQEFRDMLYPELDAMAKKINEINQKHPNQTKDGLLNFTLTEILNQVYPNARYHDYNEIIGFLECCKMEYYRKKISPYEDMKESENGSVRQFDLNKKTDY